jgi:catechol 2,3-dioxygenase-like lactoylglutathione lyase family enzyme
MSSGPIRIRGIDHVVIRVVDLERMLGFYRDLLGCAEERRVESLGLVQLRAGHSLIDLVPVHGELGAAGGAPPGREGRNMDHFCLRLEAFDAAAITGYLRENGIDPGETVSRYGAEGDGPSIYVADPEGNTVELKGPPAAPASD